MGPALDTMGHRKKAGRKRYKNIITKPQEWQAVEMQCTTLSESKGLDGKTGVECK